MMANLGFSRAERRNTSKFAGDRRAPAVRAKGNGRDTGESGSRIRLLRRER